MTPVIYSLLMLIASIFMFNLIMCQEEPYTPPPDRADIADPCAKNDHFTDPRFTCCASKKYNAPPMYTNPDASCMKKDGTEKIVQSAWNAFKCLVDKALAGKQLSAETLADILMSNLPEPVQSGIKTHLKNLTSMGHDPYKDIETLKDFQAYANAWNAYYTAENMACSDAGSKNQRVEIDEDGQVCYNWIDQGTRRGDCCNQTPIPFQLHPDPIVDRYYALKNWTAFNLMTLLGEDYTWENTTIVMYSNNVAACLRTALFIQQKIVDFEKMKQQIVDMIQPNYDDIADTVIPHFFSKEVTDRIKLEVANETAINLDYDIRRYNDTSLSFYQIIYADEWVSRKYKENMARYLFWTCRAHNLIMRRYKDVEISEMCF